MLLLSAPINRHSKKISFTFLTRCEQNKINKKNIKICYINQCKVTMRASSPTEKERPVSQPGSDDPSFALFSDFRLTMRI